MEDFLRIVGALNDETRVKILKFLIIHGKSCVCELESSLEMIQSRLSRHLKILKDGGFLEVEKLGSYSYYYLVPKTTIHGTLIDEIKNLTFDIPSKQAVCAS
jgi:ArsR family transcriptional regulator, arsenate/arsenite/antimonite-responsive transcriptional repressor